MHGPPLQVWALQKQSTHVVHCYPVSGRRPTGGVRACEPAESWNAGALVQVAPPHSSWWGAIAAYFADHDEKGCHRAYGTDEACTQSVTSAARFRPSLQV